MKKTFLAAAALCTIAALAGCNNGGAATTTTAAATTAAETTTAAASETTTTTTTTTAAETTTVKEETTTSAAAETESEDIDEGDEDFGDEEDGELEIMTHDDFIEAAIDDPVTVETYVQAKQSWWEDNGVGQASFYTQDKNDGGYFLYNMPCTKEDFDKMVPGTKIIVSGYKAEWSGEVEIVDSEYIICEDEDTFIAEAEDVTALLGTDELIDHQNEFVAFKGMTVEAANDEGAAFMYKWDNSGSDGDDLYFNVSKDGTTYSFTVESYLCDKDSQVYNDVKSLNIGDVIDLEGFLYWYEGANPHITAVTKA